MRSIAGWIERHATFTPTKLALRCAHERLSYAVFAARIAHLAAWLEDDVRIKPGVRIAWLGHNSTDMLALLFACAHIGAIVVPLNWRLGARELNAVLDDAGAALVIVDHSCADSAAHFAARRCVLAGWSRAGCTSLPADRGQFALEARETDADATLLLVYTSGTTGHPKGVCLSQRALLFNALNAVHMHDMSSADRILTVLPMFHVGGLNIQTLPALYCGAEVILEPRFEASVCLQRIVQERPSLTTLVPATISALMREPDWASADLSSLRCIATGSTDVPVALISALHERGVAVIQIYGSTETGPVAIYQRIDEAQNTLGAIGRAGLHTDIRLVDARGESATDGAPGEIWVRGAHVAKGYWEREPATCAPFFDGWFRSGDIAERDPSGLYWFKDRIKHVIISGGENIYPAELERVLAACPALREAAVVGRVDARWGDVPVVVAVRADVAVDVAAVLALFDEGIARYKRPHDVIFVDALPRNALGKVEVPRLREIAASS